jgi:hypothetical protein
MEVCANQFLGMHNVGQQKTNTRENIVLIFRAKILQLAEIV